MRILVWHDECPVWASNPEKGPALDTSLVVIGLSHRTAVVGDDLERVVADNFSELQAAATQAGQLVAHQAQGSRR